METIWEAVVNDDIGLPLLCSLVTGLLIGMEREVRAKAAGLRTHTLVCFASALLMLLGTHQGAWTMEFIPGADLVADPARMAHGVLTGIGFLGAGVIFRDGASVHGLTTAASLWMTAALGLLFGAGMFSLALTGAISTLAVLILFRLFYFVLPHQAEIKLKVVSESGETFDSASLRDILREQQIKAASIAQKMSAENAAGQNQRLELSTTAVLRMEEDSDKLVAALRAAPGVIGFEINPVEDSPAHHVAMF